MEGKLLTLTESIRLGWTFITVSNPLAYWTLVCITVVKILWLGPYKPALYGFSWDQCSKTFYGRNLSSCEVKMLACHMEIVAQTREP